jgi:hypothetical protein
MDRDSMQKLRLDRRLIKRRGWIDSKQLEQALEKLPDVAHKIAEPEADVEEAQSQDSAESEITPPSSFPE